MVRAGYLEMLQVDPLDELAQWQLPWFLFVVFQLAEFFGVHPEFSGHLDLSLGEVKILSCVNPNPVLLGKLYIHEGRFPGSR